MACSKLFSGDLPEITTYIIRYLQHDYKSLHSCVLVNRLLCKITIPILWENPFSIIRRESRPCNLLDTYLLFFDQEDQKKLMELGIPIISSPLKKPVFNYPMYIKTLNTPRIELHT